MLISLIILPGTGQSDVELTAGATISDLIESKSLQGRGICVNGRSVPSSEFDSFMLESGQEVAALTPSKGN